MFFKLSFRTFLIGLLSFSSPWVVVTFLPLIFHVLFPPSDIHSIVLALEMRGTEPAMAGTIVRETMAVAGPMRKAVQVGYSSAFAVAFQGNSSHKFKRTQTVYVAWFQKIPRPFLLVITRNESNGSLQSYQISEGEPTTLVTSYGLPLIMLAFSLYLVRKRQSPIFSDPAPEVSP